VYGEIEGGYGGVGQSGASGGNGANATLTNAIGNTSSTSGEVTVSQLAAGGASGGAFGGGNAGTAGNGSSSLTMTKNSVGSFVGRAIAYAGNGGNSGDITGGAAGTANATANLSSNSNLSADAWANFNFGALPQHGSNITSGSGGTGGPGSAAIANSTGTGTGTTVGTSTVSVSAYAYGSSGGTNSVLGSGGIGGSGNATATGSNAGASNLTVTAEARGGAGGQGVGATFVGGSGGNATSLATGTGFANANLIVTANAFGGAAGPGISGAAGGTVGSASSTANAITSGGGYAQATANGTAPSGTSLADARADGSGLVLLAHGTATSPVDAIGFAQARAAQGSASFFNMADPVHAAAFAVGMPNPPNVVNLWTPTPNVRAAYSNNTANVHGELLGNFKYPIGGSGATRTYSGVMEFVEDGAAVNTNHLLVGLAATQINGAGLLAGDSLRFRIVRQGVTLVDRTFTSNSAFTSYFTDTVIDLGVQNAGLGGGNLNLQFLLDLTSTHATAGLGSHFLLGRNATPPTPTWQNAAGGSWAVPNNWLGNALPNGPGTLAIFGSAISAARTVTLDENTTAGSLQFNNANAYTIAQGTGSNSLFLDNAGSQASIIVSAGSHSISAPLVLSAAGLDVSTASGTALTVSSDVNTSASISKSGGGALNMKNIRAGGLSINGGTVRILGSGGAFTSTSRLQTAPTVAGGGAFDLTDNKLIIVTPGSTGSWSGSAYTGVSGLIQNGRNGSVMPLWDGSGIVTSQTQATTGSFTSIGVATAAQVVPSTATATALWAGQTITGTDTLVMYTYGGDANLDGKINIDDYGHVDTSIGIGLKGWFNGDFNYDGVINIDDYGIIDVNIGIQGTPFSTAGGAEGLSVVAVPEPTARGAISLATALLTRRRRRCPK
jgi:hypothetical protein